jgi:RNA polymerase sigma factor (sigma-70 family)
MRQMADDGELLRRYVHEHSQQAFAELVDRHLNVVYAAAWRQIGEAHGARDIVQIAFAALAQQAQELCPRPSVLSWLYTTVHRRAANAKRGEWRRQNREREAMTTGDLPAWSGREPQWVHLRPVLDEAMHDLPEDDREAVLLRFFQGLSYPELANPLGVSEDGARKKVDRALDRLRGALAKRGITSTAAALATALSAQPPVAAPAGLAALILGGASGAAATTAIALVMSTTQKTLVVAALAAALTVAMYEFRATGRQHEEIVSLQNALSLSEKREAALRAERLALLRQTPPATDAIPEKPATPPAVVAQSPAPPLRGMLLRSAMVAIMKDQTSLSGSFVEKLGLSEAEQASFLSEINRTREKLNQLAVSHATIAEGPAGSVVITVQQFPEGQAVFDEFMSNMRGLLGDTRARTFDNEYRGDALGWVFGNFGTGLRTITVSRIPPGFTGDVPGGVEVAIPDPRSVFVVRDFATSPNANSFGSALNLPDLAAGSPPLRAILAPFADRLNAMPFIGQ